MSKVLDFFRQREPRFQNVTDYDLAQFVGTKYPEFLQDEEFSNQFKTLQPAKVDLKPEAARTIPTTEAVTRGGARVQVPDAAVARAALSEELKTTPTGTALTVPGTLTSLGGKVLLAGEADLATLYPGGDAPSVQNLRSYANEPDAPLPVEQGISEMHGLSSVPTKVAAGLIRTAPAIGVSAGLGMAGVPGPLATAIPFSADETGTLDPVGAVIAAGLPGATRIGEEAAASVLAKLPTTRVVAEVLSRDPLKLKGKVVQRLGNIEISNDAFRYYLEKGGGALAANLYLAAVQSPEILALPPEQRGEAALDAVANNLAVSLVGFAGRARSSQTLEKLYPQLRSEWEKLFTQQPKGKGGASPNAPAEEGAPIPPSGPPAAGPSGATWPTPEPIATIEAQIKATLDPQNPKAVTLITPGESAPAAPGLVPVATQQGLALVNPDKVDPQDAHDQLNAGKGGTLLGMSTDEKPPGTEAVLETRTPDGTPVQQEVVTPETLPTAAAAGQAVAPGGEQEVKPASQVIQERTETNVSDLAAPHPGNDVADYVRDNLMAGKSVERMNVVTLGGTLGLTEKEAEEWAELGTTEAARSIAQDSEMSYRDRFYSLVSLYDRMPRNVARTVETRVSQQYSTPPPLAWAASVLADIPNATAFLEPTAGHGMLAIGVPAKAQKWYNELNTYRRQRLERFARRDPLTALTSNDAGAESFGIDMARFAPDRVGMNPPFGSVLDEKGQSRVFPIINAATKAKTTTSIDLAIALNTFEAMRPTGKGFAIIGAKTGTPFGGTFGTDEQRAADYRRPVMMEFFQRFNVVDWFTIGGDLYRRMGAAWPVDIIIVHGHGKTPSADAGGLARPWVKPPRVIETWDQLAQLIPEHANDNIKSVPAGTGTGETRPSVGGTGPRAGSGGTPGPRTPAPGAGRPEQSVAGGGTGGGSPTPPAESPSPAPAPPAGVPGDSSTGIGKGTPEPAAGVAQGGTGVQTSGPTGVGGQRPVAPRPGKTESGSKPVKPGVPVEGLPASLMVPYVGVSQGPSLNLVAPRNIASQMLQAQQALQTEVGMPLDQYVADRLGRDVATLHTQLAGAQIDAVALAIRNIERGSSLITADETGVGKGRVVAALIEFARMRNMVPVFVTAKKNLYSDMVARDLAALGNKNFKPFITDNQHYYEDAHGKEHKANRSSAATQDLMQSVIRTGNLPEGAHGIFTTYDQLKADRPTGWKETAKEKFKRKVNRVERPDGPRWAMLRALAPRSLFILDEAHLAAGNESELNFKFSSVLPQARGIYYSSATFAKRPDNLGIYAIGTLMKRAGLDAEHLAEALKKGGVPMQQALTSMLAESGELVRRQQDWKGVEIAFKATSADPAREIEAADTYTSFIRDLMSLAKIVNAAGKGLEDGENQVRAEEETVAMEPITFGSRLFNLSNQYLLALRSEAIVKEAIAELKAGRKPFIALYNTMEGPILDLRARKLPISFNGILLREMQKMLTLTVIDPMAEGGKRQVELQPEDLPDGGAFYRQLEQQIVATDFSRFPISPIDYIKRGLEQAGYKVGELTARDGEVDDSGEEIVITKRDRGNRNKILTAYNDGATDAIIVNGSGSTGLSAHTDPRFKDQRQRVMIVGQPAPDINEFMQMLGRVMRSGQTSKPVYRILNTALAAERRFATMLRGKMTSLNANTTAEGESGMTQSEGFADDVFNQVGDQVVFRVMQANEDLANLLELGVGNEDAEAFEGYARYATGRFVLLPNADAQRLWDEIIGEFKSEIEQLDEQGQNPLRATAEDLRARTIEQSNVVEASGDTLFDGPAILEKAIVKPPKAPPTHEAAVQMARDNLTAARQRAQAWVQSSRSAEEERVKAALAKGQTPEQIDRIRTTFEDVRQKLAQALHLVGDTFGVDMLGDQTAAFYGVAVDLKLAGKSVSDFASASRQQLILTTNTFKGKLTLPLSKLFREGQELLMPVDEETAADHFNSSAETNVERHIITGNLLRAWEAADSSTGSGGGRPRVAIFTREDGSLATGILMPPGWTPGAGAADQVIQDAATFLQFYRAQTPLRSLATSAVHPVQVVAGRLAVPSNMQGRLLWGDPAFAGFFDQSPQQLQGSFVGYITPTRAGELFNWLVGKGIRLVAKPPETAAMRGPRDLASRGAFVSGVARGPGKLPPTVQFGGMQFVRPLELPELVRLVRDLTGQSPNVRKMRRRGQMQTLGQFSNGMISLDPRIFKDSLVAGQVLGHEIGHLVDYLPHETLTRGNLLGHLLALRGWLRQTFGGLDNRELRKELIELTKWWRPFDEAKDPKTYVDYRKSPEELYADALSVIFNAPQEIERRAPQFYKAFWEHLDKRADVREALFAVQDLLNRGKMATAVQREESIEAAFAVGEARWKQAVADRQKSARSWDGWWTRLWQELYWNFFPLEQRAAKVEKAGATLPLERDPRYFLDNLGYRDVTVMAWGRHVYEKVIQPIEAAGLTLEDLGKYLFYQRILNGDRSALGNPGGIDPAAAKLGLLTMNLELKLPKMTLLRDAIRIFHEDVFKLTQEAVEVGAYNRSTFRNVIEPNKDTYATFAVLDYLDDYIPAGIREQIGTLKDVANPFQATILKSIGLINLIAFQRAKNSTVDFLRNFYPADLVPAAGEGAPPVRKGFGVFMRLENGRPTYYYTDPYIADAFDKMNPRQLWWFVRAADGVFRRFVYPLIITYNPAFLYFMSPMRDIQRTSRNLPGVRFSVGTLPLEYARDLGEAGRRYASSAGPLIREMEANLGLGTPFDQLMRAHRDDFMADLLRRMRVMPDHQIQGFFSHQVFQPIRKLLNTVELGGMTLDTLAKVAAYRRLRAKGWEPKRAGMWIRNNAGLPNINKKGLFVRAARALVPFWNVFIQGWRADLRNMTSPNTRGGWWLRYMISNGLVRAFLAVAATGALGAALKELFDGISEYDKTNYIAIPVGQTVGGDYGRKTVYVRIPEDETARLIGGIISKSIRACGPDDVKLTGLFDFGMGQIPSVNPALTVPNAWASYVRGENPRDNFRGRDIVPDREWTAGGLDTLEPMVSWTIGQTGAPNFIRWDPDAQSTWELTLSAVPGVNRFIKVSDQGYRELQRAEQSEAEAAQARQKLRLPDKVQSLEMEYWRLARLKPELQTPEQAQRYEDLRFWYQRYYRPAWEAIQQATEAKLDDAARALRSQLDSESATYYRRQP